MPQSKPLVSVIIPAYNAAPYIAQAIDSVLRQTYKPIEIIVAEADSTDGTKTVLEPYIKKNLITYIHQEGKGLSNARNIAIKCSRGEFVALLDADDIFLPRKMEKQVGYLLEHPHCDVCYCAVWHFRDDEPETMLSLNYEYYSGDMVFPNLLKRNFILPLSVVLRRSIIDRVGFFDETIHRSEDWEYWMRLSYQGAVFRYLPETLGKCRIHPGSMSYGWPVKQDERETNMRILEKLRQEMPLEDQRRYHIDQAILLHRARLWYTYAGNRIPALQWLHARIQKKRLGQN